MSTKSTLLIGLTVIALAIGANQALEPTTPDDIRRQQQEQGIQDLSDAKERKDDQMRDDATSHVNAENSRRNSPSETRSKIKLRWLP